ncbi:MAG: ASCH domain-containing protein [Alphaproteobacteria bacterium]
MHIMKVDEKYYNLLKSGQKTIELRLFDEKRSLINIGDEIEFSNSVNNSDNFKTKVVALHKANSFDELCNIIDITKASFETKEELLKVLEQFYPIEKQHQYGVVGIEIFKTLAK